MLSLVKSEISYVSKAARSKWTVPLKSYGGFFGSVLHVRTELMTDSSSNCGMEEFIQLTLMNRDFASLHRFRKLPLEFLLSASTPGATPGSNPDGNPCSDTRAKAAPKTSLGQ